MNLININKAITGISGMDNSLDTGAIIAIIAIVMVFLVLLLIICLTDIASKAISAMTPVAVSAPAPVKQAPSVSASPSQTAVATTKPLDINDEDATVAALVASIDYREETGMNIRVVSVKEVG